jgi:lysophospholipase L1-like esterase
MRLIGWLLAGTFGVVISMDSFSDTAGAELLKKAHRILFIGDSITYDGRYVGYFETWILTHRPDQKWEIIDVGLPSETVSGLTEEGHADGKFARPVLSERLERVLSAVKPDLVIACYGMNCGIYQSLDQGRFEKYQAGITQLHDAVVKAGAEIVHVTSPTFDHLTGKNAAPDYNEVLRRYSEWLIARRIDGWTVIDLYGRMDAEIAKRRAKNPDFTFAPDGVHPDYAGHWFMAQQLIRFFGDNVSALAKNPEEMIALGEKSKEIIQTAYERMAVMRDAWLTETGHTHPAIPKGRPRSEAEPAAAELSKRLEGLLTPAGTKP